VKVASATVMDFIDFYQIHVLNPKFLLGIFIGGMAVFVFAALTIKAVGKAAGKMVAEVRRQFREIPGIMDETGKPDYASCVTIATIGAQQQMLLPAVVGVATPILTGLIFGVAGVLGVLAGALVSGFVLAIMLNNSGGAWDNAKKYVETGEHGGKSSSVHKATVVGDTVGDPFKDTAGPCINILIKLMSMVSIVFAGMIVNYSLRVENIVPPFTKQGLELNMRNEIVPADAIYKHANPCPDCPENCADCANGEQPAPSPEEPPTGR